MHLLDTSLLVTALTLEPRSQPVAEWLAKHAGRLCISSWLEPEFSAALSAKQRLGEIDAGVRLATLRLFDDMQNVVFSVVDVERTDFEDAASLCDDVELGLRAPDALHLALARRCRFAVATLDKKQARAAVMLGMTVETP